MFTLFRMRVLPLPLVLATYSILFYALTISYNTWAVVPTITIIYVLTYLHIFSSLIILSLTIA